jgi:poly(3-hydroxybutyrate) depolymerase
VAILNYTTKVQAKRSISQIMDALARAGARGITVEYEGGQPIGLSFWIDTAIGQREFALPANIAGVHRRLNEARITWRYQTEEHARSVAWRILKDWVEAQLAVIDAGLVTLDEVLLPYMLTSGGQTAYQAFAARQLMLPPPGEQAG